MGQDGANRYAYVYNHPTTFIDPSGFDGFYFDFDMDYSFDFSPSYDLSFDFSTPDMSVGTAGYYTPTADFSGGTSQMSYAGGQSYAGDSGEWGASGAYCADSYSSYMSAQYGALGESIAAQQLGTYAPSAYPTAGLSGADPASSTSGGTSYSTSGMSQIDQGVPNFGELPPDLRTANTLGGTMGVVDAFYESVPADMEAIGVGTAGKVLGGAGFAIQTGISFYDGYATIDAYEQGSIDTSQLVSHLGKVALDVGVGTVGVLGGAPGACAAACYFVADAAGVQSSFANGVVTLVDSGESMLQAQIQSYYNISNPLNH